MFIDGQLLPAGMIGVSESEVTRFGSLDFLSLAVLLYTHPHGHSAP